MKFVHKITEKREMCGRGSKLACKESSYQRTTQGTKASMQKTEQSTMSFLRRLNVLPTSGSSDHHRDTSSAPLRLGKTVLIHWQSFHHPTAIKIRSRGHSHKRRKKKWNANLELLPKRSSQRQIPKQKILQRRSSSSQIRYPYRKQAYKGQKIRSTAVQASCRQWANKHWQSSRSSRLARCCLVTRVNSSIRKYLAVPSSQQMLGFQVKLH